MLPRAFGVDLIFLPKCVSMKGVSLEEENIKTKRNNANTPDSSRPSGRGAAQLLPYSLFDDGSPRAEGVSGRHEIVHGICFPSSQSRRDLHRLGRGIKMRPHYKGKGTTLLAPINRLLFSSILISLKQKQKNVGPEFFEKQLSTKRENVFRENSAEKVALLLSGPPSFLKQKKRKTCRMRLNDVIPRTIDHHEINFHTDHSRMHSLSTFEQDNNP
jgi:hypothetical protein